MLSGKAPGQQQDISSYDFWGVKSYRQIFNYGGGVSTSNPQAVQGSTVYFYN